MSFAAALGAAQGITSVLGGISGLFGKKKKDYSEWHSMLNSAGGAREAAEKYGFNPLTLLGNVRGGGNQQAEGPPLASFDLIAQGLRDVNDVVSGDAERRRAAEQLNLDIARIKLDQARSGVGLGVTANGGGTQASGNVRNASAPMGAKLKVKRPTEITGYRMFGYDIEPSQRHTDAEAIEQRGGDLGSSLVGLPIMVDDVFNTITTNIKKGSKPVTADTPHKDIPPRIQAREWGRIPDGYFGDGRAYWSYDGGKGLTAIPPNKWKSKTSPN
ncbi:MAG: DNA pilot protein [Microviridae sp.]|nr:MAG: DNA pilot protein [Microviridae sp.]